MGMRLQRAALHLAYLRSVTHSAQYLHVVTQRSTNVTIISNTLLVILVLNQLDETKSEGERQFPGIDQFGNC